MTRLDYSRETVERQLDVHQARGLIQDWNRDYSREANVRWTIVLTSGVNLDLRTLREAYAFVEGIATTSQALAARV